jgi:hypothetical protein
MEKFWITITSGGQNLSYSYHYHLPVVYNGVSEVRISFALELKARDQLVIQKEKKNRIIIIKIKPKPLNICYMLLNQCFTQGNSNKELFIGWPGSLEKK